MKDNNSLGKDNQSRNFSSKITLENSSSPKSSPNREYLISKKERLISDPKFSNELLFEKQNKKLNINQSLNIKPENNSIYLTGIGNVNDIKTDSLPKFNSNSIDNPDISKKNSRNTINHKLSLDTLPYIFTNNNSLYKSNQFSPIFSCCEQKLNPKILNKFLYQQKAKESKYRLCKTVENTKKVIKKPKSPEDINLPIGARDYITKTREINRIKYCMNLRTESIKEYNYNIKEQINSIDYTINSLRIYKNNLENNFLNEFLVQLRALNQVTLKERLEEEKLKNNLVKLKKEINNLLAKKIKTQMNKYQIEKWLGLLIYIKEGIKINEKKIPQYISNHYKGKLIIDTTDEFEEFYKKNEVKNIRLIEQLNISNEEKMVLFKELKDIKQSNSDDKELIISILEKEKLLSLLKMRNNELILEKKEALRLQDNSAYTENGSSNILTPIKLSKNNKEKNKTENNKKINLSIIYTLIQSTFDYIFQNDKYSVGESHESFPVINSMVIKSTKALAQMKLIELCYTNLFYYKETNIKGNEALYKKLMEEIELNHKRIKAEKYKKEEELKALELYKKLQAKKDRIIFRPRNVDNYSSLVYIEKLKREAKKNTKKVKKEIDIFDYLYDIDDNKEEDKK